MVRFKFNLETYEYDIETAPGKLTITTTANLEARKDDNSELTGADFKKKADNSDTDSKTIRTIVLEGDAEELEKIALLLSLKRVAGKAGRPATLNKITTDGEY